VAGASVLILGLLAACGGEHAPAAGALRTASTPSTSPTVRSPVVTATPAKKLSRTAVITAKSQYGPMLYDASGQPIYLFDAERGTTPSCYQDCAGAWPPVLTEGPPRAGKGTREDLLGLTTRRDGSTQVTYAGHPLYYYAHEGKYQVLCHGVDEFGGTWLVVRPDGTTAPV
jgi:predicted lipoprotein with Yx(FWY)xxD motif